MGTLLTPASKIASIDVVFITHLTTNCMLTYNLHRTYSPVYTQDKTQNHLKTGVTLEHTNTLHPFYSGLHFSCLLHCLYANIDCHCFRFSSFYSFSASPPFLLRLPGLVDPAVIVEPLTEERAARTLYRIELLRKIREQVGSLKKQSLITNSVLFIDGTLLDIDFKVYLACTVLSLC